MLEQICAILDIEVFQCRATTVIPREFAFVLMNGKQTLEEGIFSYGIIPYFIPHRVEEDVWSAINARKFEITGLNLHPDDDGGNVTRDGFIWMIAAWYDMIKTIDKRIVAYRGGKLEKDVLYWLNIPSLNLETYGCPSFLDNYRYHDNYSINSCGQHRFKRKINDNDSNGEEYCPIKKANFYRHWVLKETSKTTLLKNAA